MEGLDALERWLSHGHTSSEISEETSAAEATYVIVRYGERLLAYPLPHTRQVIRDVRITVLPGGHPVLPGATHVEGRIVPVLDIGPLLGTSPLPIDGSYYGVLLAHEELEAVALAHAVLGMYTVPEATVATSDAEENALICGRYGWPLDTPEHTVDVVDVPALLRRAAHVYV